MRFSVGCGTLVIVAFSTRCQVGLHFDDGGCCEWTHSIAPFILSLMAGTIEQLNAYEDFS